MVLRQQTDYPWDGDITITIDKAPGDNVIIKVRIPGWVQDRPVPGDLYSYADGKNPVTASK